MLFTIPVTPVPGFAGVIIISSFTFITPVSSFPTGTAPIPLMSYACCSGSLSGRFVGFSGGASSFSASISVGPVYHDVLSLLLTILSPFSDATGTNFIFDMSYPDVFSSSDTSSCTALNLASSKFARSILFTATTSCATPYVLHSHACSLVCVCTPSDGFPDTTSTPASACDAPVIMFFTKSACPGASIIVKKYLSDVNSLCDMSIVTPLSLSSFRLSITNANSNPPFPSSSALSLSFRICCSSIAPPSNSSLPTVVDFPWSTCPTNTRFMCGLSAIFFVYSSFLCSFSITFAY